MHQGLCTTWVYGTQRAEIQLAVSRFTPFNQCLLNLVYIEPGHFASGLESGSCYLRQIAQISVHNPRLGRRIPDREQAIRKPAIVVYEDISMPLVNILTPIQSWMNIKKTEIPAQHEFLKPIYLCVHRGIVLIYLDVHQKC